MNSVWNNLQLYFLRYFSQYTQRANLYLELYFRCILYKIKKKKIETWAVNIFSRWFCIFCRLLLWSVQLVHTVSHIISDVKLITLSSTRIQFQGCLFRITHVVWSSIMSDYNTRRRERSYVWDGSQSSLDHLWKTYWRLGLGNFVLIFFEHILTKTNLSNARDCVGFEPAIFCLSPLSSLIVQLIWW